MKKAISVILFSLLIVGSPGFSLASAIEYRTIDGSANNISEPTWGKTGEPLLRKAIADYDDGQSTPRVDSLPSARSVSNAVNAQSMDTIEPHGASDMLWLWGQFLDHDLDLTTGASPPEPFNILVPQGDPFFDPQNSGTQIIPLDRSIYQIDGAGVRQQINQITAYIDASGVYGSDSGRSIALRAFDGTGKLKTSQGDLLPFNTLGLENAGGPGSNLFLAGDIRANEQVSLTVMHTLFVREHNRLADEIKLRLDANDQLLTEALSDSGLTQEDFIFQSARAIVAAEIQQVTYNEFLPILLGQNALLQYTGYDDSINAQVSNEFSTAAYRVGHTMLSSELQRINEDGTVSNPLPLLGAFFNPSILQNEGIDNILRGFAAGHAQQVDTLIVDDVRNFLFGPPGAGGFDLASLNIQRGRDHGIPSLNEVRSALSLTPWESFSDMTGGNSDLATAFASVYDTVDDVDLWVGGLAESPVNGGMVGETFFVIISDQLQRLRDGDRFFYLEPSMQAQLSVFDPDFQNRRLSEIILQNTDIQSIQQNVFFVVDRLPSDIDNDGIPDASDPDDDNDGIPDTLDTLPVTFSGSFSDDATTFGHISSRGDQTVTVSDQTNPAGVLVSASGGLIPAIISPCGYGGTISLHSGDSVVITCGSVTIIVMSGSADISFTMGANTMTTTLMTGEMLTINPDSLTITTGPGTTITIEIDGEETILGENETFEFHAPTDNTLVGGEIIPIEATALLLAGAQNSLAWILPIVFGIFGVVVYRIKRN